MMPSSSSTWPISFLPLRAASSAASLTRLARVGAGEARRLAGERVDLDVLGQRLAARVDLEDLRAALAVRAVDGDLAVEAARAQEGGIEDVGPVGGRDHDDVVLGLEAVHLDQELVERLLALVVPPPMPAPRWRPTASISSMKMMQGEFCLACSKRSRTREAPTPTNISTKSEPEMEKNGTPGLAGDGAREQRLAVPGGP
jgi:hypothetical protein